MTYGSRHANSVEILRSLPGHNRQPQYKPKGFNTDFQSYNPPLAYKIRQQDAKGGAMVVMLGALILGAIVAAIVL